MLKKYYNLIINITISIKTFLLLIIKLSYILFKSKITKKDKNIYFNKSSAFKIDQVLYLLDKQNKVLIVYIFFNKNYLIKSI